MNIERAKTFSAGLIGTASTVSGFAGSLATVKEGLQIVSLLLGIAVTAATLYYIIWPRTPSN